MASPRPTSPTGDAMPPASPQLTPRSKLRAELAALDESSGGEDTGPIDKTALFKSAARIAKRSNEPSQTVDDKDEDEDEEDEEDVDESITRPRGRLAARMQGGEQSKQIQSRKGSTSPHDQDADAPGDDDDEEDQVRAAPRRRLVRSARSTTPEAPPNRDDGSESEGLFVSPNAPQHSVAGSDSEDDLPTNLAHNSRFQALVARKREERLAREAEEQKKRDERTSRLAAEGFTEADGDGDVSDITDDEGGRQLTQKATRAPRKASKKALEEMNRETQRLSRSMQLAHEAKTKKKISKSALFERFNFKAAGSEKPAEAPAMSSSRPATPVSAAQTDAEMADGTPPSSPPSAVKKAIEQTTTSTEAPQSQSNATEEAQKSELPGSTENIPLAKIDKGKGKATAADLESPKKKTPVKPKRQFRVKLPAMSVNLVTIDDDDGDDELQIAKPTKQTKIDALFKRVPQGKAKETKPANVPHQLAHLSSPPQDVRRKNQRPSMTAGELQLQLQQRARAQAKLERDRRLDMLRAKGIHVQTEEERQKERDQVEDIVARARQEAEEIMAREREDAKKERKEKMKNGEEVDGLDWDDSDDDSFADSEGELQPIEEGELEFSGSDEEEEDNENDNAESAPNPMFDEDAEEADVSDEEKTPRATVGVDEDEDEDADVIQRSKSTSRRGRTQIQVLSDDDEVHANVEATPRPKAKFPKSPSAANDDSPKVPTSVLRSATKTFIPGLPVPNAAPAGLGLTQIFAGTMDDSQAGSPTPGSQPIEFMPSFDNFPDSQFSATAGASQPVQNTVLNSQAETQEESQGIQLHLEQSQMHGFDSLMNQVNGSQMSDMLNPTQDAGFADFSPLKQRFVDPPQSTVDTVLLHQGSPAGSRRDDDDLMAESPLVRRQGKLRRRGEAAAAGGSALPPTATPGSPLANMKLPPTASTRQQAEKAAALGEEDAEEDDGVSAFGLLAKAARRRRRMEKFDKKKSRAKDMVQGEAEESEDEYAGLGGADGEDSSDDEDLEELKKQMIDDAKGNDGDEAKLAAFFADRERAADSAQVDKLFRDITTGMLRKRRRGGGGGGNGEFDLSDSDDGGEARRRMKRRQFAKMQKALFSDERIGKIAENPRNAAFMKSIEDRDSDSENDAFGFEENFAPAEEESQSQQQPQQQEGGEQQQQQQAEDHIPDSQPTAAGAASSTNLGRKRTRADASEPAARPAPQLRKGNRDRDEHHARPSSLADVRRSLSSLLGEPRLLASSSDSVIPATDPTGEDGGEGEGSGGEDDDGEEGSGSSNKENHRPAAAAVVDRISLKRSGSSNLSTSSRLAFTAGATGGAGVFKVPALLRRATTNSLMSQSSTTSSASTTSSTTATSQSGKRGGAGAAGFGEDAKLRKNAGKRSGVNYFARETERREKVQLAERRREEKKWKGAEGRSKVVGGLFGGGTFE